MSFFGNLSISNEKKQNEIIPKLSQILSQKLISLIFFIFNSTISKNYFPLNVIEFHILRKVFFLNTNTTFHINSSPDFWRLTSSFRYFLRIFKEALRKFWTPEIRITSKQLFFSFHFSSAIRKISILLK